MSLNLSDPSHATPISHNIAIGLPVRGFFHVDYEARDPSALEPPRLPPLSPALVRIAVTRSLAARKLAITSREQLGTPALRAQGRVAAARGAAYWMVTAQLVRPCFSRYRWWYSSAR